MDKAEVLHVRGALGLFFGLCISVSMAVPAWAGDAGDRSGYLEEIIVTGTKRDTSQQDTPIAVSTLTATEIARTFGNDIRALAICRRT